MKKAYIAGPLFDDHEREYLEKITEIVEKSKMQRFPIRSRVRGWPGSVGSLCMVCRMLQLCPGHLPEAPGAQAQRASLYHSAALKQLVTPPAALLPIRVLAALTSPLT